MQKTYWLKKRELAKLVKPHIDGLVQDCSNSTGKALGLVQSCTEPSICISGTGSYWALDIPVFKRSQILLHPELTLWWSLLYADGANNKKSPSPSRPWNSCGVVWYHYLSWKNMNKKF